MKINRGPLCDCHPDPPAQHESQSVAAEEHGRNPVGLFERYREIDASSTLPDARQRVQFALPSANCADVASNPPPVPLVNERWQYRIEGGSGNGHQGAWDGALGYPEVSGWTRR